MANDVAFTPTTWENSPSTATPISAAELQRIDDGVDSLATEFSAHNGGTATSDHPEATGSVRGFMSAADKSKLDGITWTGTGIIAEMAGDDGAGSGLDADLLDGVQGANYLRSNVADTMSGILTMSAQLRAEQGTAGAPALANSTWTDSGLYFSSTALLFSVNGSQVASISDSGVGGITIAGTHEYGWSADGGIGIRRGSTNQMILHTNNQDAFLFGASTLSPDSHDLRGLGSSSRRWLDVWATDGTINTSDESTKDRIEDLELGLDFVRLLRKVSYARAGRTRPHAGFLAQNVRAVLDQLGVDDFAGFIDPSVNGPGPDDFGRTKTLARTKRPLAGWKNLGLRYTEFIAPAYVAIDELAEKLEALEGKIAA